MIDEIAEYNLLSRMLKDMIEGYQTDSETFKILVQRALILADQIIGKAQKAQEKPKGKNEK